MFDSVQVPNYIFIVYGSAAYLFGRYIAYGGVVKAKNILVRHSFFVAILTLLLGIFFVKDESIRQAAFTFSSVYLGFWLAEERRRKNDVRTLKYFLGLLWEELRFNTFQVKGIEANFRFLFDVDREISLNALKMGTIYSLSGSLKTTSHNAFISSRAVTTLSAEHIKPTKRADELFNTLEIAYGNVEHLKSFLHTTTIDFNNKASMEAEIVSSPLKDGAIGDMKAKVKSSAQELMIAKRTLMNARDLVSKHLDELGVNADAEELRSSVLTEEDKIFVEQAIRTEPVSLEEVFRQPE